MVNESLKLLDDNKLIKLSCEGKMRAFEEIVMRYEAMIARVIISMVGNNGDADDIGQEVFIRFYSSMSSFKGNSKLSTYLAKIAINLSINFINRRSKKWLTTIDEYNDEMLRSEDQYNKEDLKGLIQYALNKLETEYRAVVVLRSIQGFSTKETAEILNIPQGTVLSRQSRGHTKLKEILTKLVDI